MARGGADDRSEYGKEDGGTQSGRGGRVGGGDRDGGEAMDVADLISGSSLKIRLARVIRRGTPKVRSEFLVEETFDRSPRRRKKATGPTPI